MESKTIRYDTEPDFLPYFPQATLTSPICYLIKPVQSLQAISIGFSCSTGSPFALARDDKFRITER